ncbi:Holliday junction resolvase RuvX [uncultured Rikenella sp.]|uniref:Holliday junction resolvase RuvX n=1 Tax=uncultured Rikenella sp. TaxID=368003 RepID=UPI00272D4314|nr:Holliday junction resolvase RuvX [uncultured Rikenella sp.]
MSRIIAIDYGRKRVGIAATDPMQLIANPLDTVPAHEAVAYLTRYANENDVEMFVVGDPRQMNGERSESWRYIDPFVRQLRRALPGIPVVFHDERFTSVLAQRAIIEGGVPRNRRRTDKGLVDRVSAVIILQSYMEARK